MAHRRPLLGLFFVVCLTGCGTTVVNRPSPNPIINITPAPTANLEATKTTFALALQPTEQPPGIYLVREGDTLESIALAFNTTIDAITMTNGISNANVIYIGQPLVIPSLISQTNPLSPSLAIDQDPAAEDTPTP